MKIGLPGAGRPPLGAGQKKTKQEQSSKKIMMMAGGTGGHVMPALAVARYLQNEGNAIHWLGTHQGFEARLVPSYGFPISYINIQGLRRTNLLSWLLAPWRIGKAILQSMVVLLREKPHVVVSMGGYVAGPGALAAWLLRLPIVVHEQNAVAGWTNRHLSRFAKKIMVAFPHVFANKPKKVIYTGNPVRQEILSVPLPQERLGDKQEVNVLILGGSQGAKILNETVPKALGSILENKRPQVWHQTGKHQLEATKAAYDALKVKATVSDFIEDMAKAYAWADIVICRSGALTVSELANVGVCSILIPFPFAVDDHQTYNAKYLSDVKAAFLLPQSELSEQSLKNLLEELINNPDKRLSVAMACKQLAKPHATQEVAKYCLEVCCDK